MAATKSDYVKGLAEKIRTQLTATSPLGSAISAVPALYDASKTVGYNAGRLIDENFPNALDNLEKGVGIATGVAKKAAQNTPLGLTIGSAPYIYDKAKAQLQKEQARSAALGARAKKLYGELTKPVPQ
jgi:hypothetical protein